MSWTWGNRGVDLADDHLLWWEGLSAVASASGAAKEQSFDDFLANGPSTGEVPADVLLELEAAVRAQLLH